MAKTPIKVKGSIMKRTMIAVLTALMMMTVTATAAVDFSDMSEDDWFYGNVSALVDEGIINGYGDGTFKPDGSMNVDAFIKTMVVAMGQDPGNSEGYWAQTYIDSAMAMGILKEGDFEAYNVMITRAQMSMLSVRTVESLEGSKAYTYNTSGNQLLLNQITDRGAIGSTAAQSYVSQAYELGIITGYPDGSFKPNDGLKRSEAATVIRRVIDDSQRKPFVYVADEWEVRAEEILEETGYVVFTNSNTLVDQDVITEYQLKNELGGYDFGSFLSFYSTGLDKGNWSIVFSVAGAKQIVGSKEQQLYETEYILREVMSVDDTTISQILELIELRIDSEEPIQTRYWDLEGDKRIRIRYTDHLSNTLEIAAIGFYK